VISKYQNILVRTTQTLTIIIEVAVSRPLMMSSIAQAIRVLFLRSISYWIFGWKDMLMIILIVQLQFLPLFFLLNVN